MPANHSQLMDPQQFYQQRINTLQTELKALQKRKSSFAWLRLGAIIAIVFAFYLLWSFGILYVIVASVILIFTFIKLIYADIDNQSKIEHAQLLIHIVEDEIKCLNDDYFHLPDGSNHISKEHPYTNDLDIFGRASLFQYINRTTSEMGSKQLAEYLSAPASIQEISERQIATKELSQLALWIENFQAFGRKKEISFLTQKRLNRWMQEPPVFSKFKPWKWLRYLLPAIVLSVIGLFIYDIVGYTTFLSTLFLFAIIAYQINKYVAPVHEQLSKIANELNTLSASIAHIENQQFESDLLKKLQASFLKENQKASQDINAIKKILDRLDLRYNIVLSAPLNLILLWNLQQMLDLEKWKSNQHQSLDAWFNTLAHFEAMNSFGILYFNHPNWVFPTIYSDYFSIEGNEIGHPLIPEKKRVNNFITIPNNHQLMLITGSNMAGKSTYLRSIGVNTVLAMAGAAVCAKEFKLSHVHLISSMRVTDNLEESTSTFYAELKKLKTIIEKVNAGEKVFILLDEILRGTNSLDRHTGSKALIKQLIKKKAAAMIATHDLELAHLKEDFSNNILNYHFDVQVNNEELFFDYQLKPGICNSLNASILMKKIGIEL